MKKIDWFILITVLLAMAGIGVWWFVARGKKDTASSIPPPASSDNTLPGQPSVALPTGGFPLRQGDRNKWVYGLQVGLNALTGAGLSEDGVFGAATTQAVRSKYGSPITAVTQETWDILVNELHQKALYNSAAAAALAKIRAL